MDNIIIQKMLVMDNTVVVTEPFSPKGPIRGRNGSHHSPVKGESLKNYSLSCPGGTKRTKSPCTAFFNVIFGEGYKRGMFTVLIREIRGDKNSIFAALTYCSLLAEKWKNR